MSDMNKGCPEEETLGAWMEDGLSPGERAQVTAHLAVCDDCRRTVAIASDLEAPPPQEVDEKLLRKVAAQAARRPWWNWAAAAALLVAFGIAFAFSRPAPKAPLAGPPAPAPEKPSPARESSGDAPRVLAREPLPAPRPETPAPRPAPEPPPVPTVPPEKPAPRVEDPAPKPVPPAPVKEPLPSPLAQIPKLEPEPPPSYNPVFVIEPAGDLWVKRLEGEALKVSAVEHISGRDAFSARVGAAAFTLEGRASVALEKGTQASFSYNKPEDAFALGIAQGMVLVDTEGSSQRWQIQCGAASLTLQNLNGRFAVEPRGAQMAATVLEGRGEIVIGSVAQKVEIGKEIVLSRDGALFTEKSSDASRKLARLVELRPKMMTAFAANFREKEENRLFGFSVEAGRLNAEPGNSYLHAESPGYPKPGERPFVSLGIRLDRPVTCAPGMVLHFRYRTTYLIVTLRLGKFSFTFPPSPRTRGQWIENEVPLSSFEFEGVPMVPSDQVTDVQMMASVEKKIGLLDLEAVQFVRRAR